MDSLNSGFWAAQDVYMRKILLPVVIGFLVLLVGLAALFVISFRREHYRLWHLGKAEDCSGQWVTRLKTVLAVIFAHTRIWNEPYPGAMHFLMFWGVLLIFLGKIIRLFSYPVGLTIPPQAIFLYASMISEIGGVMVIGGGLLAFVRRYLLQALPPGYQA